VGRHKTPSTWQREMGMRTGKRHFASTLVSVMLLASFVPLGAPAIATAAASGLYFSEYVEGSSGNRAVEILTGRGRQ